MKTTTQIAKNLRDCYFGNNWTAVSLQPVLEDVSWEEATTQVYDCNSIATLVFHINYYIDVAMKVLEGGPLDGKDNLSFTHPPIHSAADWAQFLQSIYAQTEKFAQLVEQFPDSKLADVFVDEKYGNYYRNFHGIIEHAHYHLGQIVLLKKIIRQR